MPETVVGAGKTVSQALSDATAVLTEAGCDTPRLDAELLLSFVLGVGRERLVVDAFAELDAGSAEQFAAVVARRQAREPVAYIVGRKAFRRISLTVDRRVLIPRPETELLVEVALSLDRGARVADVGTGSGAVALALKEERPDLSVVGVDVSDDALAVARSNGAALGLDVEFVQADLLEGVPGPFDAVLSNLPYVAEGSALPPEIELYEPGLALFGGPDGMDPVRRLLPMVAGVPLLALEVGLAEAVAGLVAAAGFEDVEILRDLASHERVVVGRR
ncbi:MAG TPA: peptide chain release factor N(5)-glutamine methyltransferase [Solirubrobacteraceae bacterium]|nr:peptide chain release factor N(5)-glutamine methyltransferase [Solirubrobacteraceae bacterium]